MANHKNYQKKIIMPYAYDLVKADEEWTDHSFSDDDELKSNDIVEIRFPPSSTNKRGLEINHGDYERVYEAAAWVRARVTVSDQTLDIEPANSAFSEFVFSPFLPEEVVFNTTNSINGSCSSHNLSAKAVLGRHDVSEHHPYTVQWHIYNTSTSISSLTPREVRCVQQSDSTSQAYVKDQPVEVFLSGAYASSSDVDHQLDGIWCIGFVCENAPSDSDFVKVHLFGGYNNHNIVSVHGTPVVGTASFGYTIEIPRLHNTLVGCPLIRAIRFIGTAQDGSHCKFGAPNKSSDLLPDSRVDSVSEPTPPLHKEPSWLIRSGSFFILLAMLAGLVIVTAILMPISESCHGQIYLVAVAGCVIFTSIALLMVAVGVSPANDAIRFLYFSVSTPTYHNAVEAAATSARRLLLGLPSLLLGAIVAWSLLLSPFWLFSYLIEGRAVMPWWLSLIVDLVYSLIILWVVSLFNERLLQKELQLANLSDENPLADFQCARQLEELAKMRTSIV